MPAVCAFDPDGDVIRTLHAAGLARRTTGWTCYHTGMYVTEHKGVSVDIVGCAMGASFVVLRPSNSSSPGTAFW